MQIEDAGCATGCEIHLNSGALFDLEHPDPAKLNLRDLAATLARVCRWGGRIIDGASFYSVAQHSVYVADVVRRQGCSASTQLAALWHDGSEALTGDIPRPIKRRFPEFKALEAPLQAMIYEALHLGEHDYDEHAIKEADNSVCRREARIICRGSAAWNWGDTREATEIAFEDVDDCRLPREAFEMFWARHCALTGGG